MNSQIERIRAELSINAAWRILSLAGNPAKECKSPFREEKRPSFSIYTAGGWQRWFDHGTGQGGDVVDLWASAKGISVKEAICDILSQRPHLNSPVKAPGSPPEAFLSKSAIRWPPDMREPAEAECRALGALRSLSGGAFDLAARLGTLKVATIYGQKCWLCLDKKARAVSARRFDGLLFSNGKKSFALPGSHKDWPIGLCTANPDYDGLKSIVMVEGEPDYFAGLELAINSPINLRVCARSGANVPPMAQDAASHFVGARVIVIPHNDRSGLGEARARLWTKEILAFGAIACFLQHLPIVCDDLNDFLLQRPSDGFQLLKGFHDGTIPGQRK